MPNASYSIVAGGFMTVSRIRNNVGIALGIIFILVLSTSKITTTDDFSTKIAYNLPREPIDVVIPFGGKKLELLERCIQGIRNNGHNIRRIIVVSDKKYTDSAEWFNEACYPFSKFDVAMNVFRDPKEASDFFVHPNTNVGWIYQQLLKLYAPFIIPNISKNVLILDADVIFFRPVSFMQENGGALFTKATEYYPPYFQHMKRLLPNLKKVLPEASGICGHMLLQRDILQNLFTIIEKRHGILAWKAICAVIDIDQVWECCLSEYELYFNFALAKTEQVKVRTLKWAHVHEAKHLPYYEKMNYHFVLCDTFSQESLLTNSRSR